MPVIFRHVDGCGVRWPACWLCLVSGGCETIEWTEVGRSGQPWAAPPLAPGQAPSVASGSCQYVEEGAGGLGLGVRQGGAPPRPVCRSSRAMSPPTFAGWLPTWDPYKWTVSEASTPRPPPGECALSLSRLGGGRDLPWGGGGAEARSCPQAPSGPQRCPPPGPHPDSCPQSSQSHKEVLEGGLGAAPATAEVTAASTGSSGLPPGSALTRHNPDGQNGPWRVAGSALGTPWEPLHPAPASVPSRAGAPHLPSVQGAKQGQGAPSDSAGPPGPPGRLRAWAAAGSQGRGAGTGSSGHHGSPRPPSGEPAPRTAARTRRRVWAQPARGRPPPLPLTTPKPEPTPEPTESGHGPLGVGCGQVTRGDM